MQDIYNHITSPQKVFLLRNGEILAMASYNSVSLSGLPSLIVEGIAVAPEVQGKGIFRELTDKALKKEHLVCLRTQNPRMYRALEKYCSKVYPNGNELPRAIFEVFGDLASHMNCKTDAREVVKGYYGSLFYGKEPIHEKVSALFKQRLSMNLNEGDAVLVVGVI